jgi:hypothetical protein
MLPISTLLGKVMNPRSRGLKRCGYFICESIYGYDLRHGCKSNPNGAYSAIWRGKFGYEDYGGLWGLWRIMEDYGGLWRIVGCRLSPIPISRSRRISGFGIGIGVGFRLGGNTLFNSVSNSDYAVVI